MLARTTTLDAAQLQQAEQSAERKYGADWRTKRLDHCFGPMIEYPHEATLSRRSYLLATAPQHEAKVQKALRDAGFDAYVPMEPKSVKTGHVKRQAVLRPMLPGYVFPILDVHRDNWQIIKRPDRDGKNGIEGVLRLFLWGERPVEISEAAIQYLHDEEGHARASGRSLKKAPIPVKYGPGAWVQLDVMPWTGLMGLVDSWIVYKSRIKVAVELFGRKTLIEVSLDQVRI